MERSYFCLFPYGRKFNTYYAFFAMKAMLLEMIPEGIFKSFGQMSCKYVALAISSDYENL